MFENLLSRFKQRSSLFPNSHTPDQNMSQVELDTLATKDMVYSHVKLRLELGSITKFKADGIVNSANRLLKAGGGVDWAIHNAAGPGMQEELSSKGQCEEGQVVVSSGYKLPCTYVLHTVTPVWSVERPSNEDTLRLCYRNIFQTAHALGLESIAIPAIGTGVHETPIELSAKIAKEEYREYFSGYEGSINEIIFVSHTPSDFNVYRDEFECFEILPRTAEYPVSITRKINSRKVVLSGRFVVHCEPSSTNKAILFLDAGALDSIDFVDGRQEFTIHSNIDEAVCLTILSENLREITFKGKGEITIDGYFNNLSLNIDGNIDSNLYCDVDHLSITLNGYGNVLGEKQIRNAEIDHHGEFDVSLGVTDSLFVEKDGYGNIEITGNPVERNISNDGIGSIRFISPA